jgi:hypothetical protein
MEKRTKKRVSRSISKRLNLMALFADREERTEVKKEDMNDTKPLYNSRIIKIYLDYLGKYYPNIDINALLHASGMTLYEAEDQAHWFDQKQVDRFYTTVARLTGNPRIAREAGQYSVSTEAIGILKQYMLGFTNIISVYRMMEIIARQINKGIKIKTTKLNSRKVEITSIPKPGVEEKFYQCENRMGMFESVPRLFTKQLAHIEHPECFHRGDKLCRYIISWENPPFVIWRQLRNYMVAGNILALGVTAFLFPINALTVPLFSSALLCLGLLFLPDHLEKRYLKKTLEMQGNSAKDH